MRASSYDSFRLERLACGDTSQSTRRVDTSTCYRTSSAPRTTLRTDRRFEKVTYRMGPIVAIREVHPSEPPIYRLSDDLGETLGGTFYEPKLPKLTALVVTLYRVESMLQHCGGATADVGGVVRLPSKFNSWIDAKALADDRQIRRRRSGRNYQHDVSPWNIFGTACPKAEIVFLCQIVVLYTVIVVSRYNVKALS